MQGAQPRLHRSGGPQAVTVVRAWCCRLLDGAHPWGSFDAVVGRYGLRRYRLTLFPPGISAADRRLLRLWRGDAVFSPGTTLLVAAATYLGAGAVLFVLTAGVRASVRSIWLILLTGDLDPRERQCYAEWERLVDVLTRADILLKAGAINPTQHEALWWQAYDRLEIPAHA
jgi:hypothetical protein